MRRVIVVVRGVRVFVTIERVSVSRLRHRPTRHSFISQENHSSTQRSNAHLNILEHQHSNTTLEHRYKHLRFYCVRHVRRHRARFDDYSVRSRSEMCGISSLSDISGFVQFWMCDALQHTVHTVELGIRDVSDITLRCDIRCSTRMCRALLRRWRHCHCT